ncbi:MAG: phosphatase PAP2 family protein [bacterium]
MTYRTILRTFSPGDFITICFLCFLIILNLVFHTRVEQWLALVTINVAVIVGIVAIAQLADRWKTKLLVALHRWYCYPIILFVFKEIYLMVRPIHPVDYDSLLMAVDYWMFGVHPTQWLAQFSHPLLTEVLQIGYFSYYLLFIILGVEIYRRYSLERFDNAAFLIVYGFYLSYLGYFLLPAVGPRFTLHDFQQLQTDLPGLLLTDIVRGIINAGESINLAHPNPVEIVQRDVFPSGHTQLTLIVLYLGFKNNLRSRWLLLGLGTVLLIGTVYLRYHYVIDLIGGFLFFLLTIWTGQRLHNWWDRYRNLDTQTKFS